MKTKLIALLKTSFASKGFSQKTLEGIADRLIENNNLTDQSTDEDFNSGIEAFKPFADLTQSEISRQVNEKKVPAVEPTNPVVPVVTPEAPTTTDPVLLALLAELKELKTGLATVQGEKVATTRESSFTPLLKGASPKFQKTMLELAKTKASLSEEDYNAWVAEATADIAEHVQEIADSALGGDRVIAGVGGRPTDNKVDPNVASFIKKAAEQRTAGSSEKV